MPDRLLWCWLLCLQVVLKPSQLVGGAFGPHVPAPWMRRAQLAREEALLEMDSIGTPMANRPGTGSSVRSARGATPRSVRKDALDELSKNMYYTARVSSCAALFEATTPSTAHHTLASRDKTSASHLAWSLVRFVLWYVLSAEGTKTIRWGTSRRAACLILEGLLSTSHAAWARQS